MMNALNELEAARERKDEGANVALAERVVSLGDRKAVSDLVAVLQGRDKALQSDAIKVLYEIGERKPGLISGHADAFVALMESRENRLVWGAMCALDAIAGAAPDKVAAALPRIMAAVDKGTVITRDHAVKAMVKLAAHAPYTSSVMPLLHEQLRTCPVNQLPMYAELVATVGDRSIATATGAILAERLVDVPQPAKRKRLEKVLKRLRA